MYNKIKQLLIECANVDEKLISPNAKLKEDLGFDSLYSLEMALELETAFDIQIDYTELSNVLTVNDVVNFVNKKIEEEKL